MIGSIGTKATSVGTRRLAVPAAVADCHRRSAAGSTSPDQTA